jgi:hypothetical protein
MNHEVSNRIIITYVAGPAFFSKSSVWIGVISNFMRMAKIISECYKCFNDAISSPSLPSGWSKKIKRDWN